jgi:hypothetical protein
MGVGVVARGLAALAAISRLCAAAPSGIDGLAPRAATCNTASNRACWTNGFSISTDYEASVPLTGVTRTVRFPVCLSPVADVNCKID